MLTDPQSITHNAIALSLPRQGTSQPERLGKFATSDGNFEFTVRQDKTSNRFRREVRLTQRKVAADPISALNKELSASVILVIDEPRFGFSDAELALLSKALIDAYTASTYAMQVKLLSGEN
jgi:hypothetical protein